MTVHMIRYRCSADADTYLINSYLPQWLTTHEAWSEADNQPPVLVGGDYQPEHYHADWRFSWSEDEAVLLDNLEQFSVAYAPWVRIEYHVCYHDEQGTCDDWNVRENGTVPAGVPSA